MSNPGRAEATKPFKKKKKDGDSGLSKAIIGKLHIPKKGKKKEGQGSSEESKSPQRSQPEFSVPNDNSKGSEDFLNAEAVANTSTPVKAGVPPKPEVDSPLATAADNAKLIEAERPISPKEAKSNTEIDKSPEGTNDQQNVPKFPEPAQKTTAILKEHDEDDDADTTSLDTATSTEPEVHSFADLTKRKPATQQQQKAHSGLKRECLYKILVIGELGTGKTSIIKRYVHQFFSQHYRATIGVDFALKVLNWDQNTIIRLQLWDIAGQERFGNMTRVYYKEAVGAFIVFDVTRAATFDAVVKWKQDLDAKVQLPDGSPIPCVLLANKCDQQKEGIVNNANKMNEYCEEHKFTAWFETSAKDNINIEEAAKTLVDKIVQNDSSSENGRNGARDLTKFPLESSEDITDGKSCNC